MARHRIHRIIRLLQGLIILVVLVAIIIAYRYGGGKEYPDLSTTPILPDSALQVVVKLDDPPGNISVSSAGRIFFTLHPGGNPKHNHLVELVNDKLEPFPDAATQLDGHFSSVLGLRVDAQNRLWTIDPGGRGFSPARLLAFDLTSRKIVQDYTFTSAEAGWGSFLNDLQVSPDGRTVYIADVSFFGRHPAIVLYDVVHHTVRRLLERDSSVLQQDWVIRNPIKTMNFYGGLVTFKPGVDGITLDSSGTWLYYGAMTHSSLYKIRTADLLNTALTPTQLAAKVERVGPKPLSDGLSIDLKGHVYISDVEHGAILRADPAGHLITLIKDKRLRWPDGLSFGPGGWLYFTDSDLADLTETNAEHIKAAGPFYIYRFRPGVSGMPGR